MTAIRVQWLSSVNTGNAKQFYGLATKGDLTSPETYYSPLVTF